MIVAIICAASRRGVRGPEGREKLAGGAAKRNDRNRDRLTITPRRGGRSARLNLSRAPAGARPSLAIASGGSRSLRSLHHRLICLRPPGDKAAPSIALRPRLYSSSISSLQRHNFITR